MTLVEVIQPKTHENKVHIKKYSQYIRYFITATRSMHHESI